MKIQGTNTEITRDGVSESRGFAIKASAQAFRILSDGLYSDKVRAIIRELGSNAWDAHIEAGTTDRPFQVHLPNEIEPWYAIRDYGTGLSHDKVMGLYSTYFDSTKDSSNDFTGAMGLGSKSPFSYTDAFTVTSFYNGEKRIYMIDIGTDGVPHVGLVDGSPFPTDEHNGLEIKIAVKRDDFWDFQRKAEQVFKRYPLVPEVVGTAEFEIEKVKYSYQGEGWRLIDGTRGQSYAIQGTVAYPIRVDNLQGIDYDKRRLYVNLAVELDFDIGELEVSASREDLGYDERTSKNIMAAFERAVKDLTEIVQAEFDSFDNHWDAEVALRKVHGSYSSGLHQLVAHGLIKPKFDGEEIDTSTIYVSTAEDLMFMTFQPGDYTSNRVARNYKPGIQRDRFSITPSEGTYFVVDDLDKGGVMRFKHHVNENASRSDTYILIRKWSKDSLKELRETLGYGNKPFLRTSKMTKPPKVARDPRAPIDDTVAEVSWFTGNTRTQRDRWKFDGEVALDDVEYTVDVYQGNLDHEETYKDTVFTIHNNCPGTIYEIALRLKLISGSDRVYGVPRNLRKRFKKNAPEAKDLVQLVSEYINENKDQLTEDMQKAADAHSFRQKMGYNFGQRLRPFKWCHDNGVGGATVKAFFRVFGDHSVDENWLDTFSNAARLLDIEIDKPQGGASAIEAKWQLMTARYPMLKYLEGYGSDLETHEQVDARKYVELVDKKES